ncbi:anthranilate synthase component II [Pseudomonas mangiferae]|uniref:anthranilate synthase n=1 Tax=Pseudomonas mangiferae TaxID=2593654 RepID=A0A553H4Z9_9PSED|nr:aminodeoxychorismate/anthranilate synthase component II [Pseudomonas mangiferae]TRX76852.1 aminodeoxychorismate/anthranilate synthase component II [Pseudomonas mangiferae]
MRITLLDNFDSFTYNLVEQLRLLDVAVTVMRNDTPLLTLQDRLEQDSDLLLVSPGPGHPQRAGCLLPLLNWARGRLPVIGVCLGHQALAIAAGGQVGPARQPVHGKSSRLSFDRQHGLFAGLDDLRVARYHSLVVSTLPPGFETLAESDGEIMAMADSLQRQLGLQFHPESVLTTQGQRLLENALHWCVAPPVRDRRSA